MPVPVWDCTDMSLLNEPLDTSTVVSDDVWKKFDLDVPQDYYHPVRLDPLFEDLLPVYENDTFIDSCEIRHHDCMWAGLCISKEHNSTLPTKKDPQVHRKVPAGRSLLIPKTETISQQTQLQKPVCRTKSLESDGDSLRPDTPQSSESEAESDNEVPIFRHDQISINERLSECFAEAAVNAVPVSVVTGQHVRTPRKRIESECKIKEETDVRYTLSDHCYHLNQPAVSKKLEHLGVQTPSDSGETGSSSDTEEEIDVVSYEKPCRQTTVLPTFPSPADQQQFQLTVKTAFKEKPSRPRGRPPLAANARKRAAPQPSPVPATPTKRPKRSKTYQKRSKYSDIDDIPIPPTTGIKCIPPSRSSSDDEPDTEKRSLHNNMERQRRIDLRRAFEELRLLVPGVERNEKAPKVAILRQAAAYCDKMNKEDQVYSIQVTELQNRQERLRAKLSQLRKDFANSR